MTEEEKYYHKKNNPYRPKPVPVVIIKTNTFADNKGLGKPPTVDVPPVTNCSSVKGGCAPLIIATGILLALFFLMYCFK